MTSYQHASRRTAGLGARAADARRARRGWGGRRHGSAGVPRNGSPAGRILRAEILLEGTTRLLAATDTAAVVRTLIEVAGELLQPAKVLVTVADEAGRHRLAAAVGCEGHEIVRLVALVEARNSSEPASADELWSEHGDGDFAAWAAAGGARAGLVLPIAGDRGTAGTLVVLHRDDRPFPEGYRDAARRLCSQAAVALAVVRDRDDLEQSAAELNRRATALESAVAERTRELRRAIEQLEGATEARTELLSSVSHELRTPLTAILGFSDLLIQGADGPLNPDQLEDVRTIDRSGRRLLELVDDLLDAARIRSGELALQPEPLDLGALVTATVDEIRPVAGAKGLAVTTRLDALPQAWPGDAPRLRDVFLSLLDNAVKFTPAGGRIDIAAACDDEAVSVTVTDSGVGIAADRQAAIFETFGKAAGPQYVGAGLGLAIARELARRHGGDVTVRSVLGNGSSFTVRLPVVGAPRVEQTTPPPSPP